jgi:hypothetical protein
MVNSTTDEHCPSLGATAFVRGRLGTPQAAPAPKRSDSLDKLYDARTKQLQFLMATLVHLRLLKRDPINYSSEDIHLTDRQLSTVQGELEAKFRVSRLWTPQNPSSSHITSRKSTISHLLRKGYRGESHLLPQDDSNSSPIARATNTAPGRGVLSYLPPLDFEPLDFIPEECMSRLSLETEPERSGSEQTT